MDNDNDNDNDSDRGRGVLSPADRRYLTSPDEYSRQASFERRNAIRQRVIDSFLDFTMLYDEYEIEDLLHDSPAPVPPTALRDTIAFAYLVAEASSLNAEMLVDDAVEQAKTTRAEVIKQKLKENPDDVTLGELKDLRRADDLTRQEYEELSRVSLDAPDPGMTSQERLAEMDVFDDAEE